MGLFDLFKRRPKGPAEELEGTKAEAEKRDPWKTPSMPDPGTGPADRLARLGLPGGPTDDEALRLLEGARSTPAEARALEVIVQRSQSAAVDPRLLLAAAAALTDRGELADAERVLEQVASAPALMMRADLAARSGDVARALGLVERVLARDFDYPGARERHQRFRSEMGLEAVHRPPVRPGATVLAHEPDAPFELLREVARGGAGAVYEAKDRSLERRLALKVYHHPDRDRDQLLHEARVATALAGPGVVRVLDVDPEHGWLALEWADRGSLKDAIAQATNQGGREGLAPLERWLPAVASTLARIHAEGWVHHDVKPANLLLSRFGPVLADFGTARRRGEPSPPGSLGYVSPERMKGRPSDPRDDVYGFGRLLEEVLEALGADRSLLPYRALASACTGPDPGRPVDGRALYTRLTVEVVGAT